MLYGEWTLPTEFREYVALKLLPLLSLADRKISEQHRVATHCLHNAVLTGRTGATVGDTRKRGVRLRVRVWDSIVSAGLVSIQRSVSV